jgi:hypothetical protein
MVKMDNKILDAELTNRTVEPVVKSNSDNNNAMHAKDAQLDKPLSVVDAKPQDQFAIATKSTTKLTTNV